MDRKAWIILIVCGILLALNYHFKPTPTPTPKSADMPEKEQVADGDTPPAQSNPATSNPGLVNEPHIETIGEKTETLTSTDKQGKDVVTYTFTSHGGGIKLAELLNQHVVGSQTENIQLNQGAPAPIGAIFRSPDEPLGLYYSLVEKEGNIYCQNNPDQLGGLQITKRWNLEQDTDQVGAPWRLKLKITFHNQGQGTVDLGKYSLFTGSAAPLHAREWENQGGIFYLDDGSFTNKDSNWFKKGFFSKAKPLYQESIEELEFAGVSNQFFTTLVRPKNKYAATIWGKADKVDIPKADPEKPKYAVRAGMSLPPEKLGPNENTTLSYSIYIGPKRYTQLRHLYFNPEKAKDAGFFSSAPVSEVMNYGWFSPVSVTLNRVLNWLHDSAFSKTADKWSWGLSIIALTILIRICIWPLHNKSTRTMKRMSKLQPIMKDLREKYKDNPNKLNQETMKLYKDYKINPMGGCLPMFLQIPIFFGYYRMLQYAVELRGQSFLWVDDLSMPDTLSIIELPFALPLLGDQLPINVLPILMAVTMVLQMKMTPKTGDKMQQRIMMFMPLMFFFFCYNFASALALYWTTQNIFSIGQTWLTNRLPEPELTKTAKPGKPGKKSFMERMAERAEEMQRQKAGGAPSQPMRNATPDDKKPGKKRNPKTGG
ncbi:MAG: YidC/Oxa1 family insertase periplasmic-domain containing protein [Verrucomicrobiae bacterium]|nr:YidC/Oxa1 family insertase periplasmic-domain containing protein [Verrucomicrobiae bacterium]NNJ41751.1 membrane protein insertase YidC [Akkermansiaceae bacterium]